MGIGSQAPLEAAYVVRNQVSPEAIARSLRALLPTRHRVVGTRRYTELDTFDGRVRRIGARLTLSGVNGHSSVAWYPRGHDGQLTARVEQPVSFAWSLPVGPIRKHVGSVIGVRRLLPLAEAEEHGSLLDILDERGKTVARVRIESGRVRLPGSRAGWLTLPTVITLTGLRGYEAEYARLLPVIESRPGVESSPEGLHGHLLRRIGAVEPADVSALCLDLPPITTAEAGVRRIHQALLRLLVVNEPGVRASLDTEFLHDFRVAIRRTRALLGQIRRVFPPAIVEHFSTEFSWLGRLTGPTRDMDVLTLTLRDHHGDVAADDLEALTAFVDETQQREHGRLVGALDGDRYQRLVSEWAACLERPIASTPETPNAHRLLLEVVSRRAWRLSQRIAAGAVAIDERTSVAHLHAVRLDAKKLRYLVDVTPAFYDEKHLSRILKALKTLQHVLGEINDAQVQERRLVDCGHALSAAGGPAGAVLAIGRLAEQCRHRRMRLRKPVAEALARFGAERTQAACRRAFRRAATAKDDR